MKETTHTKTEQRSKRLLVTNVMYFSECFIATYLSMFISVKWRIEATLSTLTMFVDVAKSGQYALNPSPCSSTTSAAVKKGCPITPITQSVVAKQASAMLLMVFRLGLVFTANMTSVFKMHVMGKQMIFMIIRDRITLYAFLVLSFSVPPKKVTSPHSEVTCSAWKVLLKFILLAWSDLWFLGVNRGTLPKPRLIWTTVNEMLDQRPESINV